MTTKDYLRALYFRAIDMGYQKHELKFELGEHIVNKLLENVFVTTLMGEPEIVSLFGVPVEVNYDKPNITRLWGVIEP